MTLNGSQSNSTETSMICVLGVAGAKGSIELYGVNTARKVTMHGWFAQSMGFSVLSDRPPCLIAVDSDALSADIIAALQANGHSVVVMPAVGSASRQTAESGPAKYRRSAKDVCHLAMGLAESIPHSPELQ